MLVRKTKVTDLPFLDPLFDQCRQYMIEHGNPTQWDANYPTSQVVAQDIEAGTGYVCVDENDKVIGSFALADSEIEYDRMSIGKWSYDEPYKVVHRMAAVPGSGAGQFMMRYIMDNFNYIRIDTHESNKTMLHIFDKLGFKYCGKVNYAGYGERVTYDYKKV